MSSTDPATEPTMDEILASIRRIISDDPVGGHADGVEDDILDLSNAQIAQVPPAAPEPPVPPAPAPPPQSVEERLPPHSAQPVMPPAAESAPHAGFPAQPENPSGGAPMGMPGGPAGGFDQAGLGFDPNDAFASGGAQMPAPPQGMPPAGHAPTPPVPFGTAKGQAEAALDSHFSSGKYSGEDPLANMEPPVMPETGPADFDSMSQMPLDLNRDTHEPAIPANEALAQKLAEAELGMGDEAEAAFGHMGAGANSQAEAAAGVPVAETPPVKSARDLASDLEASLASLSDPKSDSGSTSDFAAAVADAEADTAAEVGAAAADPLAGFPDILTAPMRAEKEAARAETESDPMIAGMSGSVETEAEPEEAVAASPAAVTEPQLSSVLLQDAVRAQLQPAARVQVEAVEEEIAEESIEEAGLAEVVAAEAVGAVESAAEAAIADVEPEMKAAEPEAAPSPEPAGASSAPRTLEQSIQELLKPMLREWLDDNMPRIVEDMAKNQFDGGKK